MDAAGLAIYTPLPPLQVEVSAIVSTVTTASSVTCSKGGDSVPIVVSVSDLPFDGIEVSIIKTDYNASVADAVDPSADLTPSSTVLKFDTKVWKGVLGFSCAATVAGTTLDY